MQKIVENSRQVPKTKQYMAHPGYNDVIYSYLQSISHWDGIKGEPRYIYKHQLNYSNMAKELGISRQTISKKVHFMLDGEQPKGKQKPEDFLPLIKYDPEQKIYILVPFERDLAMLVGQETLFIMVSLFKQHVISAYVYLYNRYFANNSKPFQFTYSQIKQNIGIGNKSRGNDNTVVAILYGLERVGLLKWHQETTASSRRGYIDYMTNEVKNKPEFEKEIEQKRYNYLQQTKSA